MKRILTILRTAALIALVALVALVPARAALAQDGPAHPSCNGLNDADCQLLLDASAAMNALTSVAIPSFEANLMVETDSDSLELAIEGDAAFRVPSQFVTLINELPKNEVPSDLTPYLDFIDQLDSEMLLDMLGDTLLHVNIADAYADVPEEMSGSISAEAILKDSSLFVRLPSPAAGDTWFGDMLEFDPQTLAELDAALADLKVAMLDEEFQAGLEDINDLNALIMPLQEAIGQYIVTTRQPDITRDGQALAVFETNFDFKGLLASTELSQALADMLSDPAFAGMLEEENAGLEEITPTQVQFALMTISLVLGDDTTLTQTQYIGLDDGYLHGVEGDLNLTFDLASLIPDMGSVIVSGDFAAGFDAFNAVTADDVPTPEDYQPLETIENYYVGSADQISGALEPGVPVRVDDINSSVADIYTLDLEAGDEVSFELDASSAPFVSVYDPYGFAVLNLDTYADDLDGFTAGETGTYLVVVEAYWGSYELTATVE